MSKITEALDDGLKDVIKAGEEGGEGLATHMEETGALVDKGAAAHAEGEVKITGDLTKAGEVKADPLPDPSKSVEEPKASGAEADAAAEAEAKKKAEEEAAAAAEAAKIKAKVDTMRTEGHAPQRHLDASDEQLEGRLGQPLFKSDGTVQKNGEGYVLTSKKMDPARTDAASLPETDPLKYKDMYKTTAAGAPKNHSCGNFATAFGRPEDLASAEDAARAAIPAGSTGRAVVSIDAKTAIGDDGMANLRGKYIDPSNPVTADATGATTINYKDANFDGAQLTGVFDQDPATGKWGLTTLYPEPQIGVNP